MPSSRLQAGERTFLDGEPIDVEEAIRQHAGYCRLLESSGVRVELLRDNLDYPDSVFIEDTAIILPELAIQANMGTPARAGEPHAVAAVLARHREVARLPQHATLEGGDVLQLGRTLLVGLSGRTNAAGAEALQSLTSRFGYRVEAVPVRGCLHLKTGCGSLPDGRLLVHSKWLNLPGWTSTQLMEVPEEEPWAANLLRLDDRIIMASEHRRTAAALSDLGFDVQTVPLGEFAKAEGGATCLSLLL